MCCFRLHFSDFKVLFFQKKIKNLFQFTFETREGFLRKNIVAVCFQNCAVPPYSSLKRDNINNLCLCFK